MYRAYYKTNSDWLEKYKDFNTFVETLDFLDSIWSRWYIVLLGKFKLWKSQKKSKK